MFLKELVIQNYRGYKNQHRIPINQLTAFIGRNDIGKSTIFDALAVFFDHPLGKMDSSDVCVRSGCTCEVRIGCVFTNLPEEITIDSTSTTSLSQEYLLNQNLDLEIHKIYPFSDGKIGKPKVSAVCMHPTASGFEYLLHKKNSDLKSMAERFGVDESVDRRSNVALRKAIWDKCDDLQLQTVEIQLDKEDAKSIWENLSKCLPDYALFRADRSSTDEDAEVQDPLKIAVRQALMEVESELDTIKEKVKSHALEVASRTITKLADFDRELASELNPVFKSDPKWDGLFKLSLTSDDDIPINKRGSGVRRLVLFSFFRAEAERLKEEHAKGNIIYAVEEPETAQHPSNQQKVIAALHTIAESDGCQVMLTTHVPGLASLLPVESIRHIVPDSENGRSVKYDPNEVIKQVASDLGVIPDKRVKVIVCVEGPHDLRFLKRMNSLFITEDSSFVNIFANPKVALVVLGGSTLQEWVNQHYLKNLGLPEVHIYDRDELQSDGTYKYQSSRDSVNNRNDGSLAVLTIKREMENYLHLDAINEALNPVTNTVFSFNLTDECDVEKEIEAVLGKKKIQGRKTKHWLNEDAADKMTLDRLRARNGYEEVKLWFLEIANRIN